MLLSPGVSLNIIKGVESDSWEEFSFKEIDRSEVKENAVSTGNVDKNLSSVSFSDLQAEDEHGEKREGEEESWVEQDWAGHWGDGSKCAQMGGKYPALNITNVPGDKYDTEVEVENEAV